MVHVHIYTRGEERYICTLNRARSGAAAAAAAVLKTIAARAQPA